MSLHKTSYQQAVEAVRALSPSERERLFACFGEKTVATNDSISRTFANTRFSKGYVCPKCGKSHINRFGYAHNRAQRYICKDCGKTFLAPSESVLQGVKKDVTTVKKYIFCMANGWSIRKSAEFCGISKNTSYNWRHKILVALLDYMNRTELDGIIEVDGTYFLESFTGNHTSDDFEMPREPRKRGGKASKRGISSEQICVIGAVNRDGKYYFSVVGNGRPTNRQVKNALKDHIQPSSTLCTDGHVAYRQFAKDEWLNLVQIKGGRATKKGIYHIQHANKLHDSAKKMVNNFNGVATKHLPGYMAWCGIVCYNSGSTTMKEKENRITRIVTSYYGALNCRDISKGTYKSNTTKSMV